MPLTGSWSVQWGDQGENELVLGQWDVISIPINVMRGFRPLQVNPPVCLTDPTTSACEPIEVLLFVV